MKVARWRSLAAKVYVFAIVCTLLVVVSHVVLMPRVGRAGLHARLARDQQALAEVIGLLDRSAAVAAVERIAATARADVLLVAADGEVIARAGRPFDPRGGATHFTGLHRHLAGGGFGPEALTVPGDGPLAGSTLYVHGAPPPVTSHAMLLVIGLMVALITVTSLWFARSLARPLGRLARAAEALGDGQLATRVRLDRRDELGQLGLAFDQMAERLSAVLEANRALVANVSHELRTPLARIRVALELADDSPADAREQLAGITGDLGELERLVDDILTMTRLARGAATPAVPPLRSERCAPAELAERAGDRYRQLPGRGRLALDVAADLPAIDGDPVLLRRVLDNLLDNAARHGASEAPVELRVAPAGELVRFEVVDRGRGLSPDELTHVFTPFWRSDASRSRDTGGVGLGLALAREIARAHGGELALVSEPGTGTRAILQVPRAA